MLYLPVGGTIGSGAQSYAHRQNRSAFVIP
jgi:hypothetical protein